MADWRGERGEHVYVGFFDQYGNALRTSLGVQMIGDTGLVAPLELGNRDILIAPLGREDEELEFDSDDDFSNSDIDVIGVEGFDIEEWKDVKKGILINGKDESTPSDKYWPRSLKTSKVEIEVMGGRITQANVGSWARPSGAPRYIEDSRYPREAYVLSFEEMLGGRRGNAKPYQLAASIAKITVAGKPPIYIGVIWWDRRHGDGKYIFARPPAFHDPTEFPALPYEAYISFYTPVSTPIPTLSGETKDRLGDGTTTIGSHMLPIDSFTSSMNNLYTPEEVFRGATFSFVKEDYGVAIRTSGSDPFDVHYRPVREDELGFFDGEYMHALGSSTLKPEGLYLIKIMSKKWVYHTIYMVLRFVQSTPVDEGGPAGLPITPHAYMYGEVYTRNKGVLEQLTTIGVVEEPEILVSRGVRGTSFNVRRDTPVTASSTYVLEIDDPAMSSPHLRIMQLPTGIYAEDMGSVFGVWRYRPPAPRGMGGGHIVVPTKINGISESEYTRVFDDTDLFAADTDRIRERDILKLSPNTFILFLEAGPY